MNNRDLFKRLMGGLLSVVMIASASTAVLATTTEADYTITSAGMVKEITYLYGVVVEVISETSIMVDWYDSSYGRTVVYCDDMPNLQAGSYVYVESDGIFMESYPMQLNAYKVLVLEATTTEPVYNPEESTQTTVATTYDGQYTMQTTDVLTSESGTTKAPRFILTNGLITKINLDTNRMMVDDRYIFDYITGTEIGDVVDLVMVNGVIYDIWATPYENYTTLTPEQAEKLIIPAEPVTTYHELSPDEEVTHATTSETITEVTTTTTFEYCDTGMSETSGGNVTTTLLEVVTTTFEYCDTGMSEASEDSETSAETTKATESVTDNIRLQNRGIIKEISDSGYVIAIGDVLITVGNELIADEELAIGDIIGFYNEAPENINEPNPLNWGGNTEVMKITLGDANSDGKVSINDIIEINKYIVGNILLSMGEKLSADIDNDGRITMADNMSIAMYLCKRINSLNDLSEEIEVTVPEGTTTEIVNPLLYISYATVIEVIDANNFVIPWDDGGTYQITFNNTPEISAGDMVKLEWGGTDGPLERRMISVTKVIRGDINQDGVVDDLDVQYIKKKIEEGYDFTHDLEGIVYGDVNSDNKVTIEDAILIEKYIAGEITSFNDEDIKKIEESMLKEAFFEAMKDEDIIKSYNDFLDIENIELQLIANVDGYSICLVPGGSYGNAFTSRTYDGYTFLGRNYYSTSPTGLYLIKDSEVYTLADAYNLNIIDIKKIYDSLPKENYNGKIVAVTDRTAKT